MVLCIIALPVFAILSIFSVKYRKLTLEALDCVFRTATFRKCRSGLDDRIKSAVTGKAMGYSPKIAGFIYNNYKIISWAVLIIFVWSIYGTSVGIYNYAKYGNCNGPSDTGFCVFDPTGSNSRISDVDVYVQSKFIAPKIETNDPIIGSQNASLTIIEFGCYACPYSQKAEPIVKEVLDYYKGRVNLQFKTFHIPQHVESWTAALAGECALEQNKYNQYHYLLFGLQGNITDASLTQAALQTGLNITMFESCLASEKYKSEVDADTLQGLHAGVQGTPTFFINNQTIVGPKPFRTFKAIIDKELEK